MVLLEEARKRWKKTAERVRRHVQVSKEAEEQRAHMREQEEARSDLFALRKQLGCKGIPFSAVRFNKILNWKRPLKVLNRRMVGDTVPESAKET